MVLQWPFDPLDLVWYATHTYTYDLLIFSLRVLVAVMAFRTQNANCDQCIHSSFFTPRHLIFETMTSSMCLYGLLLKHEESIHLEEHCNCCCMLCVMSSYAQATQLQHDIA